MNPQEYITKRLTVDLPDPVVFEFDGTKLPPMSFKIGNDGAIMGTAQNEIARSYKDDSTNVDPIVYPVYEVLRSIVTAEKPPKGLHGILKELVADLSNNRHEVLANGVTRRTKPCPNEKCKSGRVDIEGKNLKVTCRTCHGMGQIECYSVEIDALDLTRIEPEAVQAVLEAAGIDTPDQINENTTRIILSGILAICTLKGIKK